MTSTSSAYDALMACHCEAVHGTEMILLITEKTNKIYGGKKKNKGLKINVQRENIPRGKYFSSRKT